MHRPSQLHVVLALALAWTCAACGRDESPASQQTRRSNADRGAPEAVDFRGSGQSKRAASIARLTQRADPNKDNWQVEVLNEAIGPVTGDLLEWIKHPDEVAGGDLERLVTADFRATPQLPDGREVVFEDGLFRVSRWSATGDVQPLEARGLDALLTAFEGVQAALGPATGRHGKIKVFHVEIQGESDDGVAFETLASFEAAGSVGDAGVQFNASWRLGWLQADPEGRPRLTALELTELEEIQLKVAGGELFADATASALDQNEAYEAHVLPGLPHWLTRLPRSLNVTFFGGHGFALGDVNGDGLDDMFVGDAGGLVNRLYVQNPDGTLTDRTEEAGVGILDYTAGALFADLDNDGDQDLIVATRPDVLLYANDGKGRFKLRSSPRAVFDPISMAAADYDNDGDLDLYVCNYNPDPERGPPGPIPYYDAENGDANAFLRNEGSFEFVDVTGEVGLDVNNKRFSYAAAWEDYDNDGDLDLYVANDFGRNNLYRNEDGKRFVDVAAQAGVEDIASGMSVSWGDYDRDGLMDIYISNMWSSAGGRVTFQPRFESSHGDLATQVQRFARGNTLYRNNGDGTFSDASLGSGTTMGRWAWSSRFADINNDGWSDVVISNGYVTNEDPADL